MSVLDAPNGVSAEPSVPVLVRVGTEQRFTPVGDQESQITVSRGNGHWTI